MYIVLEEHTNKVLAEEAKLEGMLASRLASQILKSSMKNYTSFKKWEGFTIPKEVNYKEVTRSYEPRFREYKDRTMFPINISTEFYRKLYLIGVYRGKSYYDTIEWAMLDSIPIIELTDEDKLRVANLVMSLPKEKTYVLDYDTSNIRLSLPQDIYYPFLEVALNRGITFEELLHISLRAYLNTIYEPDFIQDRVEQANNYRLFNKDMLHKLKFPPDFVAAMVETKHTQDINASLDLIEEFFAEQGWFYRPK
jgi:hypothetical protein